MEQSHSGKGHHHTVFVTGLDNKIVAYRTAGLGDIFHAAFLCPLDVVGKGEKCVGAEAHAVDFRKIFGLFFVGERLGTDGEIFLPVALGANVLFVFVYKSVDDIVAVGTADVGLKGERKNLIVLTQKPGVGLAARKTGAMNSRLLTCPNADCLPVEGEANRV